MGPESRPELVPSLGHILDEFQRRENPSLDPKQRSRLLAHLSTFIGAVQHGSGFNAEQLEQTSAAARETGIDPVLLRKAELCLIDMYVDNIEASHRFPSGRMFKAGYTHQEEWRLLPGADII